MFPARPPTDRVPDGSSGNEPGSPPSRSSVAWWIVAALASVGFIWLIASIGSPKASDEIDYAVFLQRVTNDQVVKVTIDQSSGEIHGEGRPDANGKVHEFTTQGPTASIPDADLALLDEHDVARKYKAKSTNWLGPLLSLLLPIAIIVLLWAWMSRRMRQQWGGAAAMTRSPGKVHTTEQPSATFAEVAGYEGVKEEVREVVEFLRNPAKFRAIGARIPKGVLLVGPPGTGKTLIARAVAGEAGVPFISVTGSDFMEMFVGVGAARVRDLFTSARRSAPSIVFIDEIDSIGRKRGTGLGGGHDEREQTLNQILAEMDGFETTEGIVVMAATNRPDILDPALLRAGRFDRQVIIPLPELEERVAILGVHCRGKALANDIDLEIVARGTPGMSGADLANLVNEAALIAVRRGAERISRDDLDAARDRVLMGLRRTSLVLSDKEKEVVATHEAGHAVMAALLDHADPVHKVTILPTGMALGLTQQLPVEERHLASRRELEDALAVRLGGRAAEQLMFGDWSTGAANDLVEATQLARRMVREWGMSSRLGPMAWGPQGAVFLGEDLVHTRDYSDETAHLIDVEVERILEEQDRRARDVLTEHELALRSVAAALIERETVDGDEVRLLVRTSRFALAPSSNGDRPQPSSAALPTMST